MLNEHTLDQLRSLRLDGMVRAIEDQTTTTAATALGFDERLALLVQREIAWRDGRRVARLMKAARLKVSTACVEDINWRASTRRHGWRRLVRGRWPFVRRPTAASPRSSRTAWTDSPPCSR